MKEDETNELKELKARVTALEEEVRYLRKQYKQLSGFNSLNQKCK